MELDSEKNNPTISELVSSMKNVMHLQAIYYYFILRKLRNPGQRYIKRYQELPVTARIDLYFRALFVLCIEMQFREFILEA